MARPVEGKRGLLGAFWSDSATHNKAVKYQPGQPQTQADFLASLRGCPQGLPGLYTFNSLLCFNSLRF
jgi:hypothetical protein